MTDCNLSAGRRNGSHSMSRVGPTRTSDDVRCRAAIGGIADIASVLGARMPITQSRRCTEAIWLIGIDAQLVSAPLELQHLLPDDPDHHARPDAIAA
jgi:hypothetical protein